MLPAIFIPRVRSLARVVSGYLNFSTRNVMSGMCRACAGAVGFSTPRSLSCAGCSLKAIFVNSRITLWRPDLTNFGSCVTRRKLLLSRVESVSSRARSNGSISRASSRACDGVIPLGRKLGRAPPERCAPDAVVLSIAGRCRNFDG